MIPNYKKVFVNSTLAFISAFIITTTIHELGHYLFYLLFGVNPTLYHNYVQTLSNSLTNGEHVISALAGPLSSLTQGLIFGIIVSRSSSNATRHLVFLWLSLLGFVNFFGYLVMTPLSSTGDTGKAAELLGVSSALRWWIAIVGFAILLWVIRKMAQYFSRFIPSELEREQKSKYIYHLMFFPIIAGSMVNTALAFPVVAFLSIIYPATSTYVIMSSFPVILKRPGSFRDSPEIEEKIVMGLGLMTLCGIILNRLLTLGWG